MKKHLLMVATIILCMSAYAQEAKKDLPLPAREVVERMEKEILAAKQKAIQGLTKVLSDVVKTGNLEAANKVKAKLEEITSETAGLPESPQKLWYICKWTCSEMPNWVITLTEDGTVRADGGLQGKWMLQNDVLTITWTNSRIVDTIEIKTKGALSYRLKNNIGKIYKVKPVKD